MSKITDHPVQSQTWADRADELFQQHRDEIYVNTDQLFAKLMFFQWIAGIVMALLISPQTWAGQTSQVHMHVWAAIFVGGAISVFPIWMTRMWPGAVLTRHVVAVAQMLMSALLIGLTGGRIETHFHVFGSLVILSFYRDWRVLIPATLVVALDHFLRGVYWPYSVYGVLSASPWRSIEHAAWVVFEDVFLVISCFRSIREMRFIANRTAALESSEQGFRQIFEEAPIGMAVVSMDERFTRANGTLCQMVGYSESELRGRTPMEITYPDDVEEGKQLTEAMLSGTRRSSVEKRYVRKTGEVIWATRTACVIRDKIGNPLHYLTMVEDITQRKNTAVALQEAKDEAERANSAKSEFLSRMSHELRTPLNAVLGFSQLMLRQAPGDTRLNHIIGAGRHLLDLINEVLEISRIEAGNLELSLEPVSLTEALGEALDLMRPLAEERALDLAMPLNLDENCYLMADRQRLKQVLLNLLSNAVKYTPKGGRITVSCTASGSSDFRVTVRDTGMGIAAENLSRLFTPFDRLGAEESDVQGTGLGLALCQRLMHAMGGTIGVESTRGQGSVFWIELPRADVEAVRISAQKKINGSRNGPASRNNKRTVLYIEDNLSNVKLIEELFGELPDTELITAMQGRVALDLARQHAPDLILLDLHLPDLPGWQVLDQLKADETTREIPVVVISADATVRQINRLMDAGACDYLTKPLDVDKFFRVLENPVRSSAHTKDFVAA